MKAKVNVQGGESGGGPIILILLDCIISVAIGLTLLSLITMICSYSSS